tara:strand:+ start:602 stop:910 length:309 start_codon:yes stop_codon:yes gene_type:complete
MAIPNYRHVEHPRFEQLGFHIEDGQYKDVIYTYGKVSWNEDKENDKLKLKFDYDIHENPNKCNTDSGDFINVIGDILAIEVEKDSNGNSGEDRENSSQESNT